MRKILAGCVSLVLALSLCSCAAFIAGFEEGLNGSGASTAEGDSGEAKNDKKELTYGDTFTFDKLEITCGGQIKWTKLNNQFSDKNGADVMEVPVTIKNISDETHGLNPFYYNFYGPDGNEIDSVSTYFDNDVFQAGDMRSGATQSTFFHILYSGDGDYYIEFSTILSDKIEVKLPVKK